MILLLGGSGYIGEAFARELTQRNHAFRNLRRSEADYTQFDVLRGVIQALKPDFVINSAGFTGKPNVDACEAAKAETLSGNVLLPMTVAHACSLFGIPWAQVSSGCIYSGAKIRQADGSLKVEKDLTQPALQDHLVRHPESLVGFSELDPPNFSFREGPCSFYSGTKALAEETLTKESSLYVWRLRIPFDERDGSRNYLSKVLRYGKVYDNINSISHRSDFARACLDLWDRRAPFGTYNVTNPGWVSTRQVVAWIEKVLQPKKVFEYWKDDVEFYREAGRTLRSNCVLDTAKLTSTGIRMRSVEDALEDALRKWVPEPA